MTLLSAILIASISFAGYNNAGHGCMLSTWNMTEMDTDQDEVLSFEEYSDSYQESLSESFKIIDTNQDGMVDKDEWNKLREIHGIMNN
jgi:hypothetical protein